jgi:hypothetical protein
MNESIPLTVRRHLTKMQITHTYTHTHKQTKDLYVIFCKTTLVLGDLPEIVRESHPSLSVSSIFSLGSRSVYGMVSFLLLRVHPNETSL